MTNAQLTKLLELLQLVADAEQIQLLTTENLDKIDPRSRPWVDNIVVDDTGKFSLPNKLREKFDKFRSL